MSEKISKDELDLYIARLDPKDFNSTRLMVTKMVKYIESLELDNKDAEWRLELALTQLESLNKTHEFEMECYRQCEEQLKACETALEDAQLHSSYAEEVKSLESKIKKIEKDKKQNNNIFLTCDGCVHENKNKNKQRHIEACNDCFRKSIDRYESNWISTPEQSSFIEKETKEFFITFTGIDCQTELSKLPKEAEYGILFSTKNDTNRYPSIEAIHSMSDYLSEERYMISLHICGSGAKEMLLNKEIKFINNFQRIQVNGKVKFKKALDICNLYPDHIIIFQYNEDNKNLITELKDVVQNCSFLVDGSGGKGLSPDNWFNPDSKLFFGYAGGLGEDNIQEDLAKINKVSSDYFWIDMESKIRDENDFFSISKIKNILKLTKE